MATAAENVDDIKIFPTSLEPPRLRFKPLEPMSKEELQIIIDNGFWVTRDTWKKMSKEQKATFYLTRRKFLALLGSIWTGFTEFEEQTSQLTKTISNGDDHEKRSQQASDEWMQKYVQLQQKYDYPEGILMALNTMLGNHMIEPEPVLDLWNSSQLLAENSKLKEEIAQLRAENSKLKTKIAQLGAKNTTLHATSDAQSINTLYRVHF